MPSKTDLPIEIRSLTHQNAVKARPDPDFHSDIDRLIQGLENRFGLAKIAISKPQIQSLKTPQIPKIWLHGWSRYGLNDETPDLVLDWKDHYDKPSSIFPNLEEWERTLAPQLVELKQAVDKGFSSQTIEFKSTLPLPPLLAVGHTFPQVGHYKLKIKQSEEIWQSYGMARSPLRFEVKEAETEVKPVPDLAIGFGITGNAWPGMERLLQDPTSPLNSAIYMQIPQPGSVSIDNAEAISLAIQAKDLIRYYKQEYDAERIHLILFAPAAYALFLGHYLNRLGDIIAYEFISGHYQPAVRIKT